MYLNIYFLALTPLKCAALIDDELANTKVSKQLICEPEKYTIYERFQDIEHGLSGSELIYDLWQNWGAHKSQVQFRLKINKQLELSEDRLKLNVCSFTRDSIYEILSLIFFFPFNRKSKILGYESF